MEALLPWLAKHEAVLTVRLEPRGLDWFEVWNITGPRIPALGAGRFRSRTFQTTTSDKEMSDMFVQTFEIMEAGQI